MIGVSSLFLQIVCFVFCGELANPSSLRVSSYDSRQSPSGNSWQETVSQGAPNFERCAKKYGFDRPLLLVQSLDGFATRFVPHVPSVAFLFQQALHAKHMRPVFPTSTYPNHYSIVTGLYPESHGIIDQTFYSADNTSFFVNYRPSHAVSDFWKGHPIWEVAQQQGRKVFTKYWPGGDVVINGVRPTNWTTYSDVEPFDSIANTVINWIRLPVEQRPDMILAYLREPDSSGHAALENSAKFQNALQQVENYMTMLMNGLTEAGLVDCVDLIVLSDHGIAQCLSTVDPHAERANPVDAYRSNGAMNRVTLAKNADVDQAVSSLSCPSQNSPYQVYKKEDLPVRLHYVNSAIIAPVIILPNISDILFPPESNQTCIDRFQMHGWDNLYDKMQSIFMAYGPSFKTKTTVEPFENVELFNLLCDLLNIQCVANNGTLGSLRHIIREAKEETMHAYHNESTNFYPVNFISYPQQNVRAGVVCKEGCREEVTLSTLPSDVPRKDYNPRPAGTSGGVLDTDISYLSNSDSDTGYNTIRQIASWVSFELPPVSGNELQESLKSGKGVDCIYKDPRVNSSAAFSFPCAGLNVPNTNATDKVVPVSLFPPELATTNTSRIESILHTNIVPMYRSFYEEYWRRLLQLVASWNRKETPMHIYVGPAWDRKPPFGVADSYLRSRDTTTEKDVLDNTVPTHFYLVAWRQRTKEYCLEDECSHEVISFILPHHMQTQKPCQPERFYFLTNSATIKDVERLTGFQWFPNFSWQQAARMRTSLTDYLWDDKNPL
ncbi:ectonucleotide pyrophosphatase/phosphodiesterase family member 3-like [Paramacrobiotus metropolitanus]|uniref:ectonucleotide pyrophosphatase/phosphodiesterase family member 3-like n=1 Tax=Paramacrobiotus metropolitanus TaxID=2943436 RepID=UPI002445CBF3|nr:ectonucleotide pyrophosphatase/phosphodiesterase family member 3-like [Paramacrobiotus metropolitanus]